MRKRLLLFPGVFGIAAVFDHADHEIDVSRRRPPRGRAGSASRRARRSFVLVGAIFAAVMAGIL